MQKHTLLVPLGNSTLSTNMLSELHDLFPVGQTHITLLQEKVQPHKHDEKGFKAEHKNFEALRMGGYKVQLRLVAANLAHEIVRFVEAEQLDTLTLITKDLDTHLPAVNALTEYVLERVKIPVLFLQSDAQDTVLTTLHPAREHRSSEYSVEPLPVSTA